MHSSTGSPRPLRLDVESSVIGGGVNVVSLRGEADLHAAPILRDALDEAIDGSSEMLIVDLSGVTFIDSMMLGVLLGATRRTRPRGIDVRIVVDDPHVRRIFELTLLDRVLQLHPSLEQALLRDEASGA